VLSAADGRRTALDAKFRLRWLDDFAPDAEEVDDTGASNERRGIFKQADLYKMHTYRDALGVPSVWILYPGDDFRFYEARRDGVDVKLPSGLRHPIDGVGAIPVKPLVEAEELREVIRTLLVADPKPMQPR
jgi:hypothetical protein